MSVLSSLRARRSPAGDDAETPHGTRTYAPAEGDAAVTLKLVHRAQAGDAHEHQQAPGHQCHHEQAGDAELRDDARDDHHERAGRAALMPATMHRCNR